MSCEPHKCGVVRTSFSPVGTPSVYRDEDWIQVHFSDVVAHAKSLLEQQVADEAGDVPDPEFDECDDDCKCSALVCTPRPEEDVNFSVDFEWNGIPYIADVTVKRTISDCVGRCAPESYHASITEVAERGLRISVKGEERISKADVERLVAQIEPQAPSKPKRRPKGKGKAKA